MRIGPANGTQHTELVKATLAATKEAILQQSGSEHLDAQADTRPAKGAVTHSCTALLTKLMSTVQYNITVSIHAHGACFILFYFLLHLFYQQLCL